MSAAKMSEGGNNFQPAEGVEYYYQQVKDDVIDINGAAFRRMMPLESPDCGPLGRALDQRQIRYAKGFQFAANKRVLTETILCDQDVAIQVGEKRQTIYVDVYRPDTEEKVPAIICFGYGGKRDTNNKSDHMPHNNGHPIHYYRPLSGLQCWEGLDPAEWIPFGYAVVNVDPTGVGLSEGNMVLFTSEDCRNGCEIIEAVAAMDWCSGKVGTGGSSWLGMAQFYYAALNPPHLACIAPFESEADPYRDEYVRGGIPIAPESFSLSYRTHGRNYMEYLGKNNQDHPFYDAYWQDKEMHPENITIPAYVVGSYTSPFHTRGTPELFNRLSSKEKWYRSHNTTEWLDLYSDHYVNDLKRFYDHYLKGEDNGWEQTPRVRVGLLNPGGENVADQPEEAYPPARMRPVNLWLNPAAGTMTTEPAAAESSVRYSADRKERCKFTYTFDRTVEVIGVGKLRLWVEADGNDDMDLFVKWAKIDSQGNRLRSDVEMGYYYGPDGKLRVSHRELDEAKSTELYPVHLHQRRLPLSKGEIVPVDIQIWPTGMIIEAGQTIELTVSTVDFLEDRPPNMTVPTNLNKGDHIVHGGGRFDSRLVLQLCER